MKSNESPIKIFLKYSHLAEGTTHENFKRKVYFNFFMYE